MLKKIITFTIIAVLMISSTITFAANDTAVTSTQAQSKLKDSLAKLNSMGIVDESDLNITGKMTRAVFSKIIVNSTGNYELAEALSGSTTFSDVAKTSAYCGYINAAVNKGYLSALSSGKFKPKDALNFAQLCTAMVRALGYTSSDIVGTWPNGYIEKAKSMGLTTGFSFKSTDSVTTSAGITMIERMLNTNIKKNNTQDADKKLKDSVGLINDQENWEYSKPEVAFNFNPDYKKLGDIVFKSGIPVLRNTVDNSVSPSTSLVGESISLSDIKDKDVVYEVYNKLKVLIYYLVIDNKIEGEITSILPSKYAPTAIQINKIDYDLGEYAKTDKFNSSNESFSVGDDVSVVLGYDGKVVDAYYTSDDNNEDYAFVANTSTLVSKEAADYGKMYYTVELFHVDGTQETYKIAENPNQYKWTLMKYSVVIDTDTIDTVVLKSLTYITAADVKIDRYEKKVDNSYTTDNIKVFNYTDSKVSIVNWTSIPNGTLSAGRVQYIGTTGDFGDVNVLLTHDVLDEQYKNYIVQRVVTPETDLKATGYTYTLTAGNSTYTYNAPAEIDGAVVGTVFKMKMYNNQVSSFEKRVDPDGLSWFIQAIDSKRIKINNLVYMFNSDVTIYYKDYSGNLTIKKVADLDIKDTYGSVKVYCNRPTNNGGKVQAVVISAK